MRSRSQAQDLLRIDGMQQFLNPLLAKISEPKLIVNCDGGIGGVRLAKKRRTGCSKFLDNPDNNPVYRIIGVSIKDSVNGDKSYFLRFSGRNIYYFLIGSGATNWTLLVTLPNDPGGINPVKFYNALFFASENGANPLYYIRNTGIAGSLVATAETATGVPTNPRYLAVAINALFALFPSGASYRLYRSEIGYGSGSPSNPFDGTQWTHNDNERASAQNYDVDANANGLGAGLAKVNNRLTIWMASDVGDAGMYFYSPANSQIDQVPTDVSIRPGGSPTIASIDGISYFGNTQGMYAYDGVRPKLISMPFGDLAQGWIPKCGVGFNMKYIMPLAAPLTLDARTENERQLTNPVAVYDTVSQECLFWDTGHRITAIATVALSSSVSPKMYTGDASGQCYVWDGSTTDDGKVIQGEIEFRSFFGSLSDNDMTFNELRANVDIPEAWSIQLRKSGSQRWHDPKTLDKRTTKVVLDSGLSYASGIEMRLTTNTLGDSPTFLGWEPVFSEETLS